MDGVVEFDLLKDEIGGGGVDRGSWRAVPVLSGVDGVEIEGGCLDIVGNVLVVHHLELGLVVCDEIVDVLRGVHEVGGGRGGE